jgi:hypothetical protein
MRPITVDKGPLLKTLRANREQHRTIFEEAVEGYRAEAVKQLTDHLQRVKSGKPKRVQIYIPEPGDHTRDYDVAIEMIEMSIGNTIELDETSFRSFVKDDWDWKRQFLTSNAPTTTESTPGRTWALLRLRDYLSDLLIGFAFITVLLVMSLGIVLALEWLVTALAITDISDALVKGGKALFALFALFVGLPLIGRSIRRK